MRLKNITKIICVLTLSLIMNSINTQAKKTNNKQTTDTTTVVINKNNKQHLMKGKATYYGNNYSSNRKTASGERFNKNALTAAHKTLPFGTMVKVTNTKNNKTVIVKINDRGPYGKGRIIDLSVAAAKELCMLSSGVVPCTLEILQKKK